MCSFCIFNVNQNQLAIQHVWCISEIFYMQIKVITITFSEHMTYSYGEAQSVSVYF